MKLTETEKQAVLQGEPLQVQDEDVKFVVLRADLFERFRGLLGETLPAGVVTELVNDSMAEFDAADPLLDSYQKYKQ